MQIIDIPDQNVLSDPMLPASLLEAFDVGQVLGRGGAAVVYEATHRLTGTPCAVKVVTQNGPPHLMERFRREAAVLAQIQHPHVVRIYGWDDEEVGWIAMERAHGTVMQLLKQGRRAFTLAQTRHFGLQTLSALEAVHAHGIVHRDVKPSNLLLFGQHLRLADFGVARTPESSLTSIGTRIGSRSFMAPEQFYAPQTVGPSADIYAFGASLYAMATRKSPMPLRDLDADHVAWRRVYPELLRSIVIDCLRTVPGDRPSLQDLQERLQSLQPDTPSG